MYKCLTASCRASLLGLFAAPTMTREIMMKQAVLKSRMIQIGTMKDGYFQGDAIQQSPPCVTFLPVDFKNFKS